MRAWSEQERIAIVASWSSSTDDQVTYARAKGLAPRTLRAWVARYGAGPRPVSQARAIVKNAIAQLQALELALTSEEPLSEPNGEHGMDQAARPDRHAEPAERPAPGTAAGAASALTSARPCAAPGLDSVVHAVRAEVARQSGKLRRSDDADDQHAVADPAVASQSASDAETAAPVPELRPIPMPDPWRRTGTFLGPF